MITNRINHAERVGKAEVLEMDQGEEYTGFLEYLNSSGDGIVDVYSIPLILYRVFPKLAPDLESHVVGTGKLKKGMLISDGCFVLDTGAELYLWIGKHSWKELRLIGNDLFALIVQSKPRPEWVSLNRVVQGAESEVFKLHFVDWEIQSTVKRKPSEKQDRVKIDVDDLYNISSHIPCDVELIEETMQKANSYLEAFTSFVFRKGKFVLLPDDERGHYYMKDAYMFLCVYNAPPKILEKLIRHPIKDITVPTILPFTEVEDQDEITDVDETSLQCVVYFCQTSKTSKLAFSTFTMQTQQEMTQLVKEMYNCKVAIQLVEFGNEPFALLAHLENNFVLHGGSRNRITNEDSSPAFFQIRTDHRYATTRAYQIPFDTSYLSSIDSYLVLDMDTRAHILWKGANVKSYGFESCIDLVNSIVKQYETDEELELNDGALPESVHVCESGTETPEFFTYFATQPQYIKQFFVNPNVFICNSSQGYFKATKLTYITQDDLTVDSCVLVDPGAPDPVHVWVGDQTPDSVLNMVRQCVKIWLQTCQDERTVSAPLTERSTLEPFTEPRLSQVKEFAVYEYQSKESIRFKSFFQSWDPQHLVIANPGNEFSRSKQQSSPMLFANQI
jgi:hypothetical protein